jgi:hypothetical protein
MISLPWIWQSSSQRDMSVFNMKRAPAEADAPQNVEVALRLLLCARVGRSIPYALLIIAIRFQSRQIEPPTSMPAAEAIAYCPYVRESTALVEARLSGHEVAARPVRS